MNLLGVLEISGSALTAERQRAEVLTSNLANAETTRTAKGGPYQRQLVIFGTRKIPGSKFAGVLADFGDQYARGVVVQAVVPDSAPPARRFEPGHPDADREGYVAYPAINPMEETVDLMGSARSYQLNVAAVQATKDMISQSLQILV